MKNNTLETAARLFTTLILGLIIGLAIIFCFTGCYNDPQSTSMEGNGVKVELLFVKDSIRVYRFSDGGRYHYFTDRLETISTVNDGKHLVDENVK